MRVAKVRMVTVMRVAKVRMVNVLYACCGQEAALLLQCENS